MIINVLLDRLEKGVWVQREMYDLKNFDVFRMWNLTDNGWQRNRDTNGDIVFTASGEPFMHPKYKVWSINTV